MFIELVIGISSFVGGAVISGGLCKVINYFKRDRELDRKTKELYESFVNYENIHDNNDLEEIKED